MRTGVFVQVRLASTRLGRKALLPLADRTIIGLVMRALSPVPAEVRALLTDADSLEALESEAAAAGFVCLAGHPVDVLGRFAEGARRLDVQRVIRATGDNPLTCPRLAREIVALHEKRRADLSHHIDNPWGTGVEVIESDALFAAEREAHDPAEREHLTTFLYRHPDRFAIVEEPAPPACRMKEARVTVDTPEDYERACRLFSDLYRGVPIESDAVVAWCRSHPEPGAAGG
jgi:spore coat polysaccharide biosynthesis protein SpsF